MKTLNVMLSNLGGRVVPIGYEGENLYTRIRINCIEVFADYPDATVSMVVNSPVGQMYPAVIEKSGVMVIWDITDAVLSSNGSGECQLTFTDGDVVRKSVVFGISINRSLIASGDPPEPVQEWIDKAEQTAQEIAENAANLAKEDIVESYGNIAPAIIETASGAIASFSDGADGMLVKTLTVDINPVQDLHGYENPWPGGGGKNLIDAKVKPYATANTVVLNQGTYTFSAESELSAGATYISGLKQDSTYCTKTELGVSTWSSSASTGVYYRDDVGDSFTFTVPEDNVTIKIGKLNADGTIGEQIEEGSTATAYAPYSNLCPISGWTEANVTATGKSLITCTTAFSGTSRDITFSGNGNDINMTGTASGTNCDTPQMDIGSFEFKKNVTYIFSLIGAKTSNDVYARVKGDGDWIWLGSRTTYDNDRYKTVFSFDSDTYVNSMRVRFYTAQGTTATVNYKWQIEVAEASASFVPFVDSDTYTYVFPQSAGTVYGGTLTIHQDGTGTLVVNRAVDDLGGRNWTVSADNISFLSSARPSGDIVPSSQSEMPKVICDIYRPSPIIDQLDMSIAIATSGKFKIRDSRFAQPLDATAFKTAMNGVKAVYELAEPVSYDLTAQQVVSMLKGVNNVWADTGDVSLEYPADTKIYIDARVAELQALILENISNS